MTVGTPYCHTRISESGRLRALGSRIDVLLDDYYQRLVGYVVADLPDRVTGKVYREPVGTVFFVSLPLAKHSSFGTVGYAVTSRHVIEGIRGLAGFHLQLNRRGAKGLSEIPSKIDGWACSPDSDLAVIRVDLPPEADFWFYPLAALPHSIHLGHDVFFVGLFETLPGVNAVDSVVRFGKIARPNVRLPIEMSESETIEMDAHLVEAISWGGESGSPVFVYSDHYKLVDAPEPDLFEEDRPPEKDHVVLDTHPLLMGVMHGHYPLERDVKRRKKRIGGVEINSGIAVVIPVKHLQDLLMMPKLLKDRESVLAERKARSRERATPKPDIASIRSKDATHESFTKADFEAALKKVARKIEPEKSG